MERYNALDEVLRGPLMGPYERGAPPSDGDWARLARVLAERTADQERWKAERGGQGATPAGAGGGAGRCSDWGADDSGRVFGSQASLAPSAARLTSDCCRNLAAQTPTPSRACRAAPPARQPTRAAGAGAA